MIFFYSVALLMDFQMLLSEIIVTTDLIESDEEELGKQQNFLVELGRVYCNNIQQKKIIYRMSFPIIK